MDKEQFKKRVLDWIKENGVDITGKRVRVYKYRGDWEVRIYSEPMDYVNQRNSRRKLKEPTDEYNCTYGHHSQKISCYTHINETDFKSKAEMDFILETIKYA